MALRIETALDRTHNSRSVGVDGSSWLCNAVRYARASLAPRTEEKGPGASDRQGGGPRRTISRRIPGWRPSSKRNRGGAIITSCRPGSSSRSSASPRPRGREMKAGSLSMDYGKPSWGRGEGRDCARRGGSRALRLRAECQKPSDSLRRELTSVPAGSACPTSIIVEEPPPLTMRPGLGRDE